MKTTNAITKPQQAKLQASYKTAALAAQITTRPSSSPSTAPALTAKVVLIGDASVGKTTVLRRLRSIHSPENGQMEGTLGSTPLEACRPHCGRPRLEYVEVVMEGEQGQGVLLKVQDTLGQEKYRSLTASFYRDTLACLIFFDTSNEESFSNLVHWLDEVKLYCGTQDVVTVIVGTLNHSAERTVPRERAEKLALEHRAFCMDVDKDSDVNVSILFKTVADLVVQKYSTLSPAHHLRRQHSKGSISLSKEPVTTKFTCCAC